MEWQPIETAPTDGTRVDVWVVDSRSGVAMRLTDCCWDHSPSWLAVNGIGWDFSPEWTPTHWMPIPAPPQEDRA